MKSLAAALIAVAVPFALRAQDTQKATSGENDGFQGTWKLDVAKSKFSPGPAPQSVTLTIAADKVNVEEVHADGKSMNWSYTPSPGTTATIDGMDNSSVTEKRVNAHTVEHTWKFGESTMQGRAVLSKDGKRMTYTLTGTTRDGKPIRNIEMFEKQ